MSELDCDHDGFGADACPSACTVPSGYDDPFSISNLMAAGPRMRWEDQEFLHDTPPGAVGDCWRTCIANLTGAPRHTVPHFVSLESPDSSALELTQNWMKRHIGLMLQCRLARFPVDSPHSDYLVLVGISPRGLSHAVLAEAATGNVVHDPHPSRAGLVSVECAYTLSEPW